MNLHVLFTWISNLNSSFICSCLTNWPVLSNIFVFSTLFCPAKVLIEELECLAEDVYSTTLTASLSILEASDCSNGDNNLPADCSEVWILFVVFPPHALLLQPRVFQLVKILWPVGTLTKPHPKMLAPYFTRMKGSLWIRWTAQYLTRALWFWFTIC